MSNEEKWLENIDLDTLPETVKVVYAKSLPNGKLRDLYYQKNNAFHPVNETYDFKWMQTVVRAFDERQKALNTVAPPDIKHNEVCRSFAAGSMGTTGGQWPEGWLIVKVQRVNQHSKSYGACDKYYYSPQRKFRFRSMVETKRFIEELQNFEGDETAALISLRWTKKQERLNESVDV